MLTKKKTQNFAINFKNDIKSHIGQVSTNKLTLNVLQQTCHRVVEIT